MTGLRTTHLSPAAHAALLAAHQADHASRPGLAAALRSLADHRAGPIRDGEPIDHWWPEDRTRRELRNIADELDPPAP